MDLYYWLKIHDLNIFDLEYNTVNGGSLRIYVCHHRKKEIKEIVNKALTNELIFLINPENKIDNFFKNLDNIKEKLIPYLESIPELYAIGASTKGNMLLQFLGLDNKIIKAIGEVNKDKYGLVTAGTNIPIISEDELFSKNPEHIFLIIWQFEKNILKKLQRKIDNGLEVIVPLPKPHIITKEGIRYL